MNFKELNLKPNLTTSLDNLGFKTPTEIQTKCIPLILKNQDVLGCAQTGTGKTAAFVLPILQNINENKAKNSGIKALIIAPTRELALQISESIVLFSANLSIQHVTFIGGESINKQISLIKKNINIVVATPGRLLDLIQQKVIKFDNLQTLVLDEADQMLDMGFVKDIKKILTYLPSKRQTLLFSATMPNEIKEFALKIQNKPTQISVHKVSTTATIINQEVYFVQKELKRDLLCELLRLENDNAVIVFVRTKYGADKLVKYLKKNNLNAVAIHGDKSQNARVNALNNFKNGTVKYLIATDIAARGIDINELPMVINFDLPAVAETYVHRIGRTGRAGKSGKAISFCSDDEKKILISIEKLIGKKITKQQHQLQNI